MPDRRIILAASLLLAAGLTQSSCSDSITEPVLQNDFTATLSGANERPNANTSTATGTATVTLTQSSLTFSISVTGLTSPTAAHIHVGKASVSGGIILGLTPATPPTGSFTGVFNSGTVSASDLAGAAVSLASLAALIRNGDAYINVHTVALPGGEIRGQLVPKP